MGFATFQLYLFMVFVRPIEQFLPEVMELRPMLILWGVTFVASVADARKQGGGAGQPTHYWILVGLALVVVFSLLFNGGLSSIGWAVGEFSTPAMMFVLTCLNITSLARFKKVCRLLVICVVLLCLETMWSYFTGFRVDELVIAQLAREDVQVPVGKVFIPAEDTSGSIIWRVRSVGFLRDPNDFAQTIVMVLPWLLMLAPAGEKWWRTLLRLGPVAGFLIWTMSHTHSRGGMLGLGAMLLFALRGRLGNVKTGLLMATAYLAFQVVGGGGGREISSKEQSANERIEAWADGMLMMKSHPIFGVGYGNFLEHHIRTAHNSYVLCFSELGLAGYFFWIALIVIGMKSVNRIVKTAPPGSEERRMAALLQASMVGFLVCAWFLSRTYIPTLYILMALAVALLFCTRQVHDGQRHQALHAALPWVKATLGTMLASIVVVSIFIRMST